MSASDVNLSQIRYGGEYDSDFECDNEVKSKRRKPDPLLVTPAQKHVPKPSKQELGNEYSKVQRQIYRSQFLALDAYSRHKALINHYVLCYPGATSKLKRDISKYKTDHDIIKENHRFLWEDESADTWGKQLAKKYYDKLYKEYCVTDLSRYKENKIAMRWRTEKEVITGKGQFSCGNVSCSEMDELRSWEVNFGYFEHGEKKNALVKVRLCPNCSCKLNYHHKKKEVSRKAISVDAEKSSKISEKDATDTSVTLEKTLPPESSECSSTCKPAEASESDIWKQPLTQEIETSRDDEFEKYLADMLL